MTGSGSWARGCSERETFCVRPRDVWICLADMGARDTRVVAAVAPRSERCRTPRVAERLTRNVCLHAEGGGSEERK